MHYHKIDLQQYLKSHNTKEPPKEVLQGFADNLSKLLKVNTNESEEHQKIALMDFLKDSFNYERNTKNRIDLSIYEDNKSQVLFEVKSLNNKAEFINANNWGGEATLFTHEYNLECKAFYESILYFLREYKTYKNNDLKYIILTNTRDFYLIDAREYLTFANDKTILKAFDNCDKNQGTDTSTQKFYTTLKDYLPILTSTLKFIYFHIQKTPLALLYQVLSPQILLKQKTYIDANTLNQNFYDELLYILGLQEASQNSKFLIIPTTQPNTLLDSICNKLKLDRDKDFEIIFSLLTTWNNRILFLRLLESMLLSFKHIDKPFLDIDTLQNFTDLNTLFFDILALKKEKRKTDLKLKDSIPYLNSSLFDKTELEKQNKEISRLDSNHLAIFKHSILKKDKDYKDTQSLPLLDYLFTFLHAYDFTTTPKDIINHTKTNYDKLINSAVLGLVFEKLNGYKEGSFYTPNFITSYMCKESLEKIVIEKFNEAKNWTCDSLESLTHNIDKLTDSKEGYKEANAIFDSIKVCDPAVGSGHFLVSMLNSMIKLKFDLKILCNENYERLKDINLSVENDEILIRDSKNALHIYQIPSHENIESHKLQKALFYNKRTLIESCLFGVDINPNSCEITKLRLWIELLKYSFYIFDSHGKNTGTLETLPNIDINIKCGNSLISHIALNITKEKLEKELKETINKASSLELQEEFATAYNAVNKLPKEIEVYKNSVNLYKNETDIGLKKIHKENITKAQDFILNIFHTMSEAYKTFKLNLSSYLQIYGYKGIDNATLQGKSLDSTIIKKLNDWTINFNFHKSLDIPKEPKELVESKLIALIDSMQNYENLTQDKNAFEWRFAFPEVLDSNGDFLGFDIVIGNPPYIKEPNNRKLFDGTRHLRTYQGKMDIWYHFVGKGFDIVKNRGIVSFIATNNWTTCFGAKALRSVILKESQILNLVDFGSYMCFDSASIQTMIMEFRKLDSIPKSYTLKYARIDSKKPTDLHRDAILSRESYENNIYLTPTIIPIKLMNKTLTFIDDNQDNLLQKILKNGKMFLQNNEIVQGIVPNPDRITKRNITKSLEDKGIKVGDGVFVVLKNSLKISKNEKKYLKPLFEVEHCKKYYLDSHNTQEIIYTTKQNCTLKQIPNIVRHLESFKEIMENRRENVNGRLNFFHLHWARNENFFKEGGKILCVRKCVDTPIFSYTENKAYVMLSFNIIKTNRINMKFLTGLLNSKLITFWLKHKGKMQGNHYQIDKESLLNLPIPKITKANQKIANEIIALVDKILESNNCYFNNNEKSKLDSKKDYSTLKLQNNKKLQVKDFESDTSKLESKIDKLVYKLYNLSDEEIYIIETRS